MYTYVCIYIYIYMYTCGPYFPRIRRPPLLLPAKRSGSPARGRGWLFLRAAQLDPTRSNSIL